MKAVQRQIHRKEAGGSATAAATPSAPTSSTAACPTTIELRGVPIHFPFKPYACQEEYMGKVLDALNRGENALLESPTGTGKTLCLLCAALAWQREQARLLPQNNPNGPLPVVAVPSQSTSSQQPRQPKRVPVILYASRTHSQISQVVRELRNTRYRPKHAVLGSREHMCVHPKVKTAHATAYDINQDCQKLNKESRKCRFRNQLEGFVPDPNEYGAGTAIQPVLDMEDLVAMGKSRKICPFYYTRSLVSEAELLLIPYNYLFDKDARETTLAEVPWDNAIVIFDEAHNLESFASESASFDLSTTQLAGCIGELTRAMSYLQAMPDLADRISADNLARLKALFLNLEEYMLRSIPTHQCVYAGEYMMEVFTKGMSITHANHVIFVSEVAKVTDLLLEMRGSGGNTNKKNGSLHLETFVGCIKRVFGEASEGRCLAKAQSYRVYVTPPNNQAGGGRTISYWCFAPSLAMQELSNLNVRSILVTSGTLSPLPSYSLELGLPFPHTLENPHIIADDQIHVRIIGRGVSGKVLTSSYQRREDGEYISELGNTIVSLARIVPGGMLIFFPSYGVMEMCVERWGGPSSRKSQGGPQGRHNFFQARRRSSSSSSRKFAFPHAPNFYASASSDPSTPWKRLLGQKSVILEPKSSADLPDAIAEFHKFLEKSKSTGCVLMGVCRGKISEGIDFAHNMCRAVVITGLPFAPYLDPKVKLKRQYLDDERAGQRVKASGEGGFGGDLADSKSALPVTLSGAEWYHQQAMRAVNQAVGRVIRNKSDYGAVLLVDSRFEEPRNQQGLSKWVRPHIQNDQGFGVAVGSLARFYKDAAQKSKQRSDLLKAERKSSVVLRYEKESLLSNSQLEMGNDHESMTKIAVIQATKEKASADVSQNGTGGSLSQESSGYIPPERIIARIDMKQVADSRRKDTAEDPDTVDARKSVGAETGLEALYQQSHVPAKKPITVRGASESPSSVWSSVQATTKSAQRHDLNILENRPNRHDVSAGHEKASDRKSDAMLFFEKAKAKVTKEDLMAIKKSVIAMKGHGNRNDATSYLLAARELIEVLVRHEPLEKQNNAVEPGLFDLLYPLLPNAFRRDAEKIALKTSFKETQFCRLCKERLSVDDCNEVFSLSMELLCTMYPSRSEESIKLSRTTFLSKSQVLLDKLLAVGCTLPVGQAKSNLFPLFCQLLPASWQNVMQALSEEMSLAKRVSNLKRIEKENAGEASVDSRRFEKSNVKIRRSDPSTGDSSPTTVEARRSMEAALMQAEELNRLKRDRIKKIQNQSSQTRITNPYASSRAKHTKVRGLTPKDLSTASVSQHSSKRVRLSSSEPRGATKHVAGKASSNSAKTDEGDPVAQCLRIVENDSFYHRAAKLPPKIKSNAPKDLTCPVCEKESSEHFISDCSHTACLSCWLEWLKKSKTCPICRAPTEKESLARMVFQDQGVAAGPPTLSQLYVADGNGQAESSDDDELELVGGSE